MNRFFIIATVFFAMIFSPSVFAQHMVQVPAYKMNDKKFQIHSRIYAENFFEDRYQNTKSNEEFKISGTRFDIVSQAFYNKNWFAYFNYRIQEDPIQQSEAQRINNANQSAGDKFFENHFGLTRELYVGYENDDFRIYGGKFRTAFGRAWFLGRGIWTQDLAINYMQLENLGFGGVVKAGNEKTAGKYEFGFSAFTKDTKNLDNSQITNRDSFNKANGDAAHERSLGSYTANIDVNFDFSENEKLFYRFAYTNLKVNSNQAVSRIQANKIEDQQGFAATMIYQYPLLQNVELDYLAEFVDMKNVNGDADISDQYFNTSAIFNLRKNWNLTFGYASKRNIIHGENGEDQQFSEISAGYSFFNNLLFDKLQIQVGHRHLRTDLKTELDKKNSYALMIRYIKWF